MQQGRWAHEEVTGGFDGMNFGARDGKFPEGEG